MKSFGSPEARSAAVFCTQLDCRQNSAVHFKSKVAAEETARIHEMSRHESVIVYLDKDHNIDQSIVEQIEELTGIRALHELIS